MIRLAVVGASGRMGRLVSEVAAGTADVEVVQRIGSADALRFDDGVDGVVDVTLPQVTPTVVAAATDAGLPVLVGTSGWSAERIGSLRAGRADGAPGVLIVPNFSVGAVLAARFAEQAATWFESIEIVEAHHAGKADSPSGTAVATAERIAAARAHLGPVAAPHTDQRARGQQVGSVPVHSLRLDGVLAKQDVLFGGPGELLTIRHETIAPTAYAQGIRVAIRALPTLTGVVVVVRAVAFLQSGQPVGIAIGIALLVLPIIGAYLLLRELRFGFQATRLTRQLAAEGPLPGADLPRRASGRVQRAEADAAFEPYAEAAEARPGDWRAWLRLGLAYDLAGDRKRARSAVRRAIDLSR